jgi:hypothetical protein
MLGAGLLPHVLFKNGFAILGEVGLQLSSRVSQKRKITQRTEAFVGKTHARCTSRIPASWGITLGQLRTNPGPELLIPKFKTPGQRLHNLLDTHHHWVGTWLSLVERCVRDAEVAGSNPVVPTKKDQGFR